MRTHAFRYRRGHPLLGQFRELSDDAIAKPGGVQDQRVLSDRSIERMPNDHLHELHVYTRLSRHFDQHIGYDPMFSTR
jgi:hypothetical protein